MKSCFRQIVIMAILLLFFNDIYSQEGDYSVSGFIYDEVSGEALIGTNILVYRDSLSLQSEPLFGTSANNYGYYVLPKLKPRKYFVVFRHIGYKSLFKEIDLSTVNVNQRINIELTPVEIKLDEVLIEAKKVDKNVLSTIDIQPEILSKLPTLSGEVDLFRILQLLPGINKSTELSNGLYVRGGSPDQTLTLVDGAVVYNPAHIGNISSTFNSNAIRDIKLIKGAFPAEYGGRLSSVLDISLKSGTKEKEKGTFGLGIINSFLSLEGPLSNTSTYLIAGRWMYYDLLQKNFDKNSSVPRYNFYDVNGKISYNISESSAFFLSALYSHDKMYNPQSDDISYEIEWTNLNLTLNWLQINSKSLLLNSTLSFINYEFNSKIGIGANTISSSSYFTNPDLTDILLKQNAEINWNVNQKLKTGFELSFHNYDLLYNEYYDISVERDPYAGDDITSLEAAFFVQNESVFFEKLKTNIGVRLFYFDNRKLFSVEPRLSLSYQLFEDLFIKSAAAIANQYLHLITRNDIALPNDLWYPSTQLIEPSKSTQYIFGLDKYFANDTYQLSLETYYRDMKNLYEFKNSPKIDPVNGRIEDEFVKGEGEAYGLEVFFQKREGKIQGWIGYTLSWTKRKFSQLNYGKVFYPKYDRRNDLSLAVTINLTDEITIGSTFIYATGLRYTLPPGQFIFNPIGLGEDDQILTQFGNLNASKFPAYHKLDLSFNYNLRFTKTDINLFINLYNIYNRKNVYAQYAVLEKDDANNEKIFLKRISLFPFIPSFGLSISF